jgi:methionyl-tRNA synthetase
MSKSKGNIVRPLQLKDKYGNDAFRYYLLRDMTFGLDATFSEVGLAERINSDLANDLGNLLNRTLGMLGKYRQGVVPEPGNLEPVDLALKEAFVALPELVSRHFDALQFERALDVVMEAVRKANKYIAETEPWVLARGEAQRRRLDTVLYCCVEALRCASILLEPVMPHKTLELRQQLGLETPFDLQSAGEWGLTPPGTVTRPGAPLFPRVDLAALQQAIAEPEPKVTHKPEISLEEFGRLELRVAEVRKAEPHPQADKLLVLTVTLGSEERTVVSGIRRWYTPEELIGKRVILVANLKPVTIRGVASQGMILAAEDEVGNLALATLDRELDLGSEVR